jgi:hypothetical protein
MKLKFNFAYYFKKWLIVKKCVRYETNQCLTVMMSFQVSYQVRNFLKQMSAYLIRLSHEYRVYSKWFPLQGFRLKLVCGIYAFVIAPVPIKCSAHVILLELITLFVSLKRRPCITPRNMLVLASFSPAQPHARGSTIFRMSSARAY